MLRNESKIYWRLKATQSLLLCCGKGLTLHQKYRSEQTLTYKHIPSHNCSCCVKQQAKSIFLWITFYKTCVSIFLHHWRDMEIWQLISRNFNIFSPTLFLFQVSNWDDYFLAIKYSLRSKGWPIFACFVSGIFPNRLTPQLIYYAFSIERMCRNKIHIEHRTQPFRHYKW